MSELILPFSEDQGSSDQEEHGHELKINYKPTEYDEEEFFLMYHMHLQPSEVAALHDEKRKWLIGRLMMQKQMEKEYVMQQRMAAQINIPNLGNLRGDQK